MVRPLQKKCVSSLREAAKKVLLMAGPLREGEVKDQAIKEKREKIKKIKFFAASLSILYLI